MRIRHRLIIAFALLLVPLFLLDVYDLAREYRERRADILRGHRETAEAVAASMEVLLQDLEDRARSVAAAAARMQSRVALTELLARCPDFEVDEAAIVWSGGSYVRRPLSVPIMVKR